MWVTEAMLLGVGILLASLLYLHIRRARRSLIELTADLPEVDPLPLIGNIHLFLGGPERIVLGLFRLFEGVIKQGGVGKVWLGPKVYIVITKPEDAQLVLENCLQKDSVYRFLRVWLGNGLFVAPYEVWKVHRRALMSVFHTRYVDKLVSTLREQSEVLVERLAAQCGRDDFDVFRFISPCTLDVAFQTAMGERMDVQRSPETPYLSAFNTAMSIINMRLFKGWLQPDFFLKLTSYAKQQKEIIDITHEFTDEDIKRKRKKYENHEQNVDGFPTAFLDFILRRDIKFTDEQLREQIDSITVAGNDATALTIAYTLVLLGAHPRVQENVFAELEEIFGDSQRTPLKEDMMKMHYLERVIKESMRLYTVVPIIARAIETDTKLSTCTVPAGAGCVIAACSMHRNKEVWGEDADRFDPDRFLPEQNAKRHPCAFIPFSHGSRNCIGRLFGMLVMKSIIASVVRNFKITANEVTRLKIDIMLFPVHGHQLSLEKREMRAAGETARIPIRPVNS